MTTTTPLADRIHAALVGTRTEHGDLCDAVAALERDLADARALYIETEERRANDSTRLERELWATAAQLRDKVVENAELKRSRTIADEHLRAAIDAARETK